MKRLPLLFVLLIACGPINEGPANPTGPTGTGGGGGPQPPKPAAAGDVSIELDKIALNGAVFGPSPRLKPVTPKVEPNARGRKPTLAQQRSIFANVRDPVLKQAQAAILATMLYNESRTDKAKEKELLTEARQALRDAGALGGKEIDEVTLRLLGSYEILLDDYVAAEKVWQDLITKDPKDKELPSHKAWLAYSMLRQGKNAEALAVLATEPLTDKQPEVAYMTAWAKWRAGDGAAAWEAITTAAKGWGNYVGKEDVEDDVMLMAGRTKVSFAQAMPRIFEVLEIKEPVQQYNILAKLGSKTYQDAGRWTDGIAAMEEALKVLGAQVPPNDRAYLRYMQADFTVRLDTPDVAVRYAKQAVEAVKACPKCTPKERQDLISAVAVMGRLFHIMYATANDIRYYQPANDLYVLVLPEIQDPTRKAGITADANTLQQTLKNTKVGTGTHGKDAVGVLIDRHKMEVQACYEERLVMSPKIGGTLVVTLDSDQSGAIKGVATEPKAGQADLAAVAGCVTDHARKWNLPKRGMAGTTRVKATFALAPAAPPAPAPAAPAATPAQPAAGGTPAQPPAGGAPAQPKK